MFRVESSCATASIRCFIYGGCTFQVFDQATQPSHPSLKRRNEYWRWFRPPLEKKRRVLRSSGPCYHACWHAGL